MDKYNLFQSMLLAVFGGFIGAIFGVVSYGGMTLDKAMIVVILYSAMIFFFLWILNFAVKRKNE